MYIILSISNFQIKRYYYIASENYPYTCHKDLGSTSIAIKTDHV